MRVSYSQVNCFWSCPYKYKLRYKDHLEPVPDTSPTNALYEGTAIHTGIETRDIEKAIENYKSNYKELTKDHEIEIMKIKTILPKAIEQIPEGEYEYKLLTDEFVGYIDMLVKVGEGIYDLADFKFSNNISGYKKSGQIHIYKYYYEKLTGNKIRNMYYVFIPKLTEKLNEGLTEEKFINEILPAYSKKDIKFEKVEYDPQQLRWFFARKALMNKATTFEKRYSHECTWCEYAAYCRTNGEDTSGLIIKKEENKQGEAQEVDLWN